MGQRRENIQKITHRTPTMLWLTGGSLSEDIARMLPAKARRIVGIVLLSVGIFLSIIGLLLMKLFEGADNGLGGIGGLIWLILLGLGIISMVVSISFFRKYD